MNNADFSRLLATNDKELIRELQAPRKRTKDGGRRAAGKAGGCKGGAKGKDQKGSGKGKGGEVHDIADGDEGGGDSSTKGYRDRAKERREEKGEYQHVAAEWESHAEVSVDQSKYLGGDMDHTHLVKGLDYALLTKVRTELTKQKKVEEFHEARAKRKAQLKGQPTTKRSFQTTLARRIWHTVVETLHPHHGTFKARMQKMGKAFSMGQRIRGAPSLFLPGRMSYEFDTDAAVTDSKNDIPRTLYMSKEDAPAADWSKKVASTLPETVSRVRDVLHRALEERRQRKRERTSGAEASYTVAQKINVTKHKARDLDNDIFQDAAAYDPTEIARKATKSEPSRSQSSRRTSSYFDDAGAEKYRSAPSTQLNAEDMAIEEQEVSAVDIAAAQSGEQPFEAADRYLGPRKGWVFKLGPKGLGYYRETVGSAAAVAEVAAIAPMAASAGAGGKRSLRAKRAAPVEDDGAYDECFPDSMLGHALMTTVDGDSDEEEGKSKLKKKKGDDKAPQGMDSSYGKKGGDTGEAKKKKLNSHQEWQKIDSMIKNNKVKSVSQVEASAQQRPRRSDPPAPREVHTATPSYF